MIPRLLAPRIAPPRRTRQTQTVRQEARTVFGKTTTAASTTSGASASLPARLCSCPSAFGVGSSSSHLHHRSLFSSPLHDALLFLGHFHYPMTSTFLLFSSSPDHQPNAPTSIPLQHGPSSQNFQRWREASKGKTYPVSGSVRHINRAGLVGTTGGTPARGSVAVVYRQKNEGKATRGCSCKHFIQKAFCVVRFPMAAS